MKSAGSAGGGSALPAGDSGAGSSFMPRILHERRRAVHRGQAPGGPAGSGMARGSSQASGAFADRHASAPVTPITYATTARDRAAYWPSGLGRSPEITV